MLKINKQNIQKLLNIFYYLRKNEFSITKDKIYIVQNQSQQQMIQNSDQTINVQHHHNTIQASFQAISTQKNGKILRQMVASQCICISKSDPVKENNIHITKQKNQTITTYNNDYIIQAYKQIIQKNNNKVISIPIKQYSNKFLRQKKKQEQEKNHSKNQHMSINHLYNNRKLVSQFKKYKFKNKNKKISINKQNDQFIVQNLLSYKSSDINTNHRTMFGAFSNNYQNIITFKEKDIFIQGKQNDKMLKTKKQFYQKICQKQKKQKQMPYQRKKCKTLADTFNIWHQSTQKQRDVQRNEKQNKFERISTSRALQKYSKILKINPQQGKLQKMKIKKQLAKSLRLQGKQKGQIETKQITLARKQMKKGFNRNSFISRKRQSLNQQLQQQRNTININVKTDNNQQTANNQQVSKTGQSKQLFKTPKNDKDQSYQNNSSTYEQKSNMSTLLKHKRARKLSYQIQKDRKNSNTNKNNKNAQQIFQDFQINAWQNDF